MATKNNEQKKIPQRKSWLCGQSVDKFTGKIIKLIPRDTGYDFKLDNNIWFIFNRKYTDAVPKLGDTVSLYTIQYSKVVGMELNGELLYFLSEEEL